MPETGLVISGNNGQPIESVYQLHDNGLYLPPMHFSKAAVEMMNKSFFFNPKLKASFKNISAKPVVHRKQLEDIVPNIQDITRYPCDCHRVAEGNRVIEIIIHLNDHHHWTRERIADWLDTLPIDLTIKKVA